MDFKDLAKGLQEATKVLQKTTEGMPERLKALKDISADEAQLLSAGTDKINSIMANINKEMAEMNSYLKK